MGWGLVIQGLFSFERYILTYVAIALLLFWGLQCTLVADKGKTALCSMSLHTYKVMSTKTP